MSNDSALDDPLDSLLTRSVMDIGIPPRPAILDMVAQELRSSAPDFRRIALYISTDVALSAGLIKTANSPYFGYRLRARTVIQALNMLGLEVAGKALAGVALRRAFPASPSMERFWDASARIAEYSGLLVNLLGSKGGVRADDAYTYGLFRDCGVPVLLCKFPSYRDTLAKANAEPLRRFTEVEEDDFPTNHTIVGCMLAQSWSLPEEICLSIRQHHDFLLLRSGAESLPVASRRLIALTQVAEHIHQQQSKRSTNHEWQKLGEASLELLDIDELRLRELVAEVTALSHKKD